MPGNKRPLTKAEDGLNARQIRFCEEYVVDLDSHQAAARAGYSAHTAVSQGNRLLQNAKIQKKIQQLKMLRTDAVASKAQDTIKELALLAHSDIAEFVEVDEAGNVTPKHFSKLQPGHTRCISKIKQRKTVRKVQGSPGETLVETVFEIALWDKVRALDLEGQYHTIWNQKGSSLSEESAAELLTKVADALEGRNGNAESA